jgi:hypothetical protein
VEGVPGGGVGRLRERVPDALAQQVRLLALEQLLGPLVDVREPMLVVDRVEGVVDPVEHVVQFGREVVPPPRLAGRRVQLPERPDDGAVGRPGGRDSDLAGHPSVVGREQVRFEHPSVVPFQFPDRRPERRPVPLGEQLHDRNAEQRIALAADRRRHHLVEGHEPAVVVELKHPVPDRRQDRLVTGRLRAIAPGGGDAVTPLARARSHTRPVAAEVNKGIRRATHAGRRPARKRDGGRRRGVCTVAGCQRVRCGRGDRKIRGRVGSGAFASDDRTVRNGSPDEFLLARTGGVRCH